MTQQHITNCKNCGSNEFVNGICLHCGTNYGKPITTPSYYDHYYDPEQLDSCELKGIVLQVLNPTDKILKAILFNFNGNPNYGCDLGLIVKKLGDDDSYAKLVSGIWENPITINRWRFVTSTPKQLKQNIIVHEELPDKKPTDTIISLAGYCNPYQMCQDSIDVSFPVKIHKCVYLAVDILPNTTLSIIAFPRQIK